MRRIYLPLLLGLPLTFFLMPGCAQAPNYWEDAKPSQKKILVAFPPLYALSHALAGDRAYVLCMLTTVGPHDHQGAASDLLKVNKADLFIYNGLTLDDDFTKNMLKNHRNGNLRILNVGAVLDEKDMKGRKDIDVPEPNELVIRGKQHKHKHADGKWHVHGSEDPHYWLSPKVAMAMTDIIAAKLAEVDPAGADSYKTRAADQVKKLKELQDYGEAAFAKKKNKKFITMHEAFKYFNKAFGLDMKKPIQAQAGIDPDAKALAELLTLCKEDEIRVIAVEPQYPKAQAETLQNSLKREGIHVQIVTLDPLETVDKSGNPDPQFYFQKMRANIDTLAKALP